MIVVPNVAERTLLDNLLDSVTTYFHLFVNDFEPNANTVLSDFIEPPWPAYGPKSVTSWTPALTVAGKAVSSADQQLWTRGPIGPGALVYGYYVTDGSLGPLLWCERRAAGPIPMTLPTQAVLLLPRVELSQCDEGGGVIQGQGDLVGDGSSTITPSPIMGEGDLVGDGSSKASLSFAGEGDLVGDGFGSILTPPIPGEGDLVGDGSSEASLSFAGEGDLVGDGTGTPS